MAYGPDDSSNMGTREEIREHKLRSLEERGVLAIDYRANFFLINNQRVLLEPVSGQYGGLDAKYSLPGYFEHEYMNVPTIKKGVFKLFGDPDIGLLIASSKNPTLNSSLAIMIIHDVELQYFGDKNYRWVEVDKVPYCSMSDDFSRVVLHRWPAIVTKLINAPDPRDAADLLSCIMRSCD